MGNNRTLKKLGGRLREESRGLVEAKLPERLRVLVDRLACLEKHREPEKTTALRSEHCSLHSGLRRLHLTDQRNRKRNFDSSAEFKLQVNFDMRDVRPW